MSVVLAKEVMKRQLLDLGISVNNDTIDKHYNIVKDFNKNLNIEKLKNYIEWLITIDNANLIKIKYNKHTLRMVIIEKWLYLCNKLEKKNFIIKFLIYLTLFNQFGIRYKFLVLFKVFRTIIKKG